MKSEFFPIELTPKMGTKRPMSPKFYVNGSADEGSMPATFNKEAHSTAVIMSKRFLCGLLLVDERFANRSVGQSIVKSDLLSNSPTPTHRPDYKNSVLLGSIVLERGHLQVCLDRLRPQLIEQIKSLPNNFHFLSVSGWTVEKNQECKITVASVFNDHNFAIAIKKSFDKPRIGVVNSNGDSIGFVFCAFDQSLLSLRVAIDDLLREALSTGSSARVHFRFVDRHGWPVLPSQEQALSVPDVLVNQSVCIRPRLVEGGQATAIEQCIQSEEMFTLSATASYMALPEPDQKQLINTIGGGGTPEEETDWKRKSKKGNGLIRRNTSILRRNKDKSSKKQQSRAKPIMLSYARNEAASHAIQLKLELVALGFSVYLDVHEIQNGSDWQDALNEAVTNCDVFVPLITPMYGKTQWTNREVKLADLLKKTIIPVNFLEQWPPECLAIQFATTQYIPWRPTEGEEPKISSNDLDIRHWPPKHVKRVSKLVAEQVPKPLSALAPGRKGSHQPPPQPQQVTPLSSSQQMLSPITPMVPFTPISPSVESFGSQLSRTVASGTLNSGETLPGPGAVSQMWYGTSMLANRPLIVIDAHPQQRKWADEIRRSLELDEFQVWCSCDWQADSGIEIDSVDSGDSDANLSTIVECNEHVQNNSGRSTIDSLHSPDRSATLDKVSSTGNAKQFSSTLDIPNACRRPTSLTSSPTRSRHTTPNRSPQASNENLHDSSTTCLNHLNQIESKTNRSEQLNGCASSTASSSSGTSSLSVSSCNMSAPAVPNNTRRALLPNRRPTSLPVGSADPPTLGERKRISRLISQSSDISQLNTLTPEKMERLKRFQDKVTSAEVVIVLVSSAYFTSRTSQKHAYYCEHRKKMILVRVDESKVSPWFANLMGEDIGLSVNNPRYLQMLRNRVRQKKEGGLMASSSRDIAESKLQYLVSYMKKNLPVLDTCVYVIGSSKLQCERSIQICKAIGQELAKLRNVTVVTSGFYGAGDLIARSFYESRRQKLLSESQQLGSAAGNMMAAQSPSTPLLHVSSETSTPCGRLADRWAASFRSQVVHILPLKEQQDFSDRCPQNPDGTFDARDYGETLFLGECMKERESVVARLLNTCIVVEGGTGTAKEAEEFIWNDSYVVPVMSTGGAASGQFGVPMKIFECPPGVNEQDWQMLSDSHATPEEVARSVVRILVHLKQSIAACAKFHQQEQINGSVLGALGSLGLGAGVKVKKSLRKKRLSEKLEQMSRTPSIASVHLEGMSVTGNYTPSSVAGIGNELLPMMPVDRVKTSKWWRVQKIIPFASKKM